MESEAGVVVFGHDQAPTGEQARGDEAEVGDTAIGEELAASGAEACDDGECSEERGFPVSHFFSSFCFFRMSCRTLISVASPTKIPIISPPIRRVASKCGNIENAEEPIDVAVPMTPFSVVLKL